MRRLFALLTVVLPLLASTPAFAGEILFVSDSTTDSANIPSVLSGDTTEVNHATIAGARYRPAASGDLHNVTIIRNDYTLTMGGAFGVAEGTNPTLAGVRAGVTLADYCAIYWSASGPHEPDSLNGGIGADGGLHTDDDVFTSLTSYVAGGGWVFVTGHDACANPGDPKLAAFLGGTGTGSAQFTRAAPNSAPFGAVSATVTFLTTAVTDIRGATPGSTTPGGVNLLDGIQDLDSLSGIDSNETIGVLAEPLSAAVPASQWTVRVPSGIANLTDPTAGRIAYVANGVFLYEDLPTSPGTFLSDGEDPSWLTDPTYNAALVNFAAASCPVRVDITCPPTPQFLSCNTLGGRFERFSFPMTVPSPLTFDVAWTIDGVPAAGSPITAMLGVSDSLVVEVSSPGPVWSLGAHTIVLTATTTAGAVTQCTVEFTVIDLTPPVVSLNGPTTMTLSCGGSYTEMGATATDVCEGPVPVTIGGDTVDPAVGGVYVVEYSASDSGGNTAMATRTVTVESLTPPVLTIRGANPAYVQCPGPYVDEGATALDACDGDLSSSVVAMSTVNAGVPGTYQVTYNVTNSGGLSAMAVRTVTVADTVPPVITLVGVTPMTVECGGVYTEPGATATDACDPGPITVSIGGQTVNTSVLGTYVVTYDAMDASGNIAVQITRTVEVVDTTPPVIALVGPASMTLECGVDSYTELGATATDNCDPGPIAVVVGGDVVNPGALGTYVVTYDAMDASGNAAVQVTRTVEVVDTTPPEITASVMRTLLWPPTGGLLSVGASAVAVDACAGPVSLTLNVYSDEAAGAPPSSPDALASGTAASLRLRAERLYAGGNGRVYLLVYTAVDPSGNFAVKTQTVVVPRVPVLSQMMLVRAEGAMAEAGVSPVTGAPPASHNQPIGTFVFP